MRSSTVYRTLSSVPNATFVYLTTSELRHLSIKDTFVCPNGVRIREVPLYI